MNKVVLVAGVVVLGSWMLVDPRGMADAASSLASVGAAGWDLAQQVYVAVVDLAARR